MRSFDFAIVGAGASGCVVASRLAAHFTQANIIMIEAGADSRGLINMIPMLSGFAPFQKGHNWNHKAQHIDRQTLLYQGKMVGGSSEVNGMVVSRGYSADYAPWQAALGDLWSHQAILDTFKRLENFAQGASEHHGADGPMHVQQVKAYGPLPQAFLEASQQFGYPIVDDLNASDGARFGLTHINTLRGRRHSARRAFLPQMPENLEIWQHSHVDKINVQNGRVTGLSITRSGVPTEIGIGCELILCGGALGTTGLLLKSGFGPADAAKAAGVKPIAEHAELGQNLQNHPSYLLRVPTHGASMRSLLNPVKAFSAGVEWLAKRQGPLAQGLFQAAGYFSTQSESQSVGAQVIMSPALFPPSMPGVRPSMPKLHGASFAIQQGTPHSRGSVKLKADGALDITTGVLSDKRDVIFMREAISRVQQILSQPAFRRHVSDVSALKPISDQQIFSSIGSAYHMAGTARMGKDDGAVSDEWLNLRGVEGIRIADASVMPLIPNAALHFPTMMIAERAAEFAIQKWA